MKVLVRRDSATVTPVDLGEGPEVEEKLRRLVREHGASVTNEDGTAVELPEETVEEAPKTRKSRRDE